MSFEGKFSRDFLKNVATTLDSYRIRVLIDAKKEILEAGVYDESQYHEIFFKVFKEERLKVSFYEYLKLNQLNNLDIVRKFSEKNSIKVSKALSLLELLKAEKLIEIEDSCNNNEGHDENIHGSILNDIKITITNQDSSTQKSIFEPVKVIYDSKNCSGCGLCAGVCPVNCLNVYNGFGKIDEEKCIRCGMCYFVCPRTFLPEKLLNMTQENTSELKEYSNIGHYLEIYSARTKIDEISSQCQDGGMSSTCLHYLFEKNKIDYALGAKMSTTRWRPEPLLIKNKEDILLTTGTKYVNNPTLKLLNQKELYGKRLAIVGVPCMMQALLKSEIYAINVPSLINIELRIGIFCMESFPYMGLLEICKKLNVDVKNVKKMDINKGKFFIHTNDDGELNISIKEISNLAREDCEMCYDLTSESADISIGSIGSPAGWNTVIIRTEKGKKIYEDLISSDLIESKRISDVKPGLSMLQKIATSKRNNCKKYISEKIKKNKRVPFY